MSNIEIFDSRYSELSNIDWDFLDATQDALSNIHPYPARFIPDIPRELISILGCEENCVVLDPFCGSSTTGIAANLLNRRYLGVDQELEFLKISKKRRQEIDNIAVRMDYREHVCKTTDSQMQMILELHEDVPYYGIDLPL